MIHEERKKRKTILFAFFLKIVGTKHILHNVFNLHVEKCLTMELQTQGVATLANHANICSSSKE